MSTFVSFECAELGASYAELYDELAGYLELTPDQAIDRFLPSEAIALLRFHRRQRGRRTAFETLALELGVDPAAVYAACHDQGAQTLLAALRAKRSPALGRVPRAVMLPEGL